jgi:hypothetical protein
MILIRLLGKDVAERETYRKVWKNKKGRAIACPYT